jgi:hypothetical protein
VCFGDVIMLWLCEGFCLFVVVMRKKKSFVEIVEELYEYFFEYSRERERERI